MRESPALKLIELLKGECASLAVYDPYIPEEFDGIPQHHPFISSVDNGTEPQDNLTLALRGADAVLLATKHDDFMVLSPRDFVSAGVRVIVDGRNAFNKETMVGSGLIYRGIGR